MEWVETTGRTIEEAKDLALDQLGVDEQDAEFEVVEEAKTGLFGRLRTEARVRARVRPSRPRAKEERRDRRRRSGDGSRAREATAPARTGSRPETSQAKAQEPPTGGGRSEGVEMDTDVPLVEQAEVGREFLTGLLVAFGSPTAAVEVRPVDEETVELAVSGADLGLLIGPQGATLNAIEELTRTAVQRQTGGRNGRIVVDVAGYRERRRAALERFTREVAAQVKETGVRKALEPMRPGDRKIVHDTVNTIEGVSTASEGEEPRRRVVIEPS